MGTALAVPTLIVVLWGQFMAWVRDLFGSRVYLKHDPALSRPCTWRLSSTDGIEARVQLASGPDVRFSLALRRLRTIEESPGRAFVRCYDGQTWFIESDRYHPELPRTEFALAGATDETLDIMWLW